MKKPTYSDAQIIAAGQQLIAESKPVTPFAIRNLLGGGNHIRIKTVWDTAQRPCCTTTVTPSIASSISSANQQLACLKSTKSVKSMPQTEATIPVPILAAAMPPTPMPETPTTPDNFTQNLLEMDKTIALLHQLSKRLGQSRTQLTAQQYFNENRLPEYTAPKK